MTLACIVLSPVSSAAPIAAGTGCGQTRICITKPAAALMTREMKSRNTIQALQTQLSIAEINSKIAKAKKNTREANKPDVVTPADPPVAPASDIARVAPTHVNTGFPDFGSGKPDSRFPMNVDVNKGGGKAAPIPTIRMYGTAGSHAVIEVGDKQRVVKAGDKIGPAGTVSHIDFSGMDVKSPAGKVRHYSVNW
jgi:hypothetical protein